MSSDLNEKVMFFEWIIEQSSGVCIFGMIGMKMQSFINLPPDLIIKYMKIIIKGNDINRSFGADCG